MKIWACKIISIFLSLVMVLTIIPGEALHHGLIHNDTPCKSESTFHFEQKHDHCNILLLNFSKYLTSKQYIPKGIERLISILKVPETISSSVHYQRSRSERAPPAL